MCKLHAVIYESFRTNYINYYWSLRVQAPCCYLRVCVGTLGNNFYKYLLESTCPYSRILFTWVYVIISNNSFISFFIYSFISKQTEWPKWQLLQRKKKKNGISVCKLHAVMLLFTRVLVLTISIIAGVYVFKLHVVNYECVLDFW